MATAAQIRNQIQSKIFTPYGKSVTLRAKSNTYNTRGDTISATNSDSTISIVPYDITLEKRMYESFSTVSEGDLFVAVPYSVTIAQGNQIIMDSVTYEVKEVVPHYLPSNLVYVIRLAKVIA
jgi:hypothetical protein